MPLINQALREIHCKIVYYGPGLCGKTTNAKHIYSTVPEESRGRLVSLSTEAERTLYFDFFRFDVGEIRGFQTRFHLYTVPGQVFYYATRKLVLNRVDGVVFVADSQLERMDANLESLDSLRTDLGELGLSLEKIPYVVQYNKRDVPSAAPIETLKELLNPMKVPDFPAVASQGVGVFETLKAVAKLVLVQLKKGG